MNNDYKMLIVLIGNSFKYEIEAVCKLFFHTQRFDFSDNIADAKGDDFIIASCNNSENEIMLSAKISLNGTADYDEKILPPDTDKKTAEHELCRIIYHILCRKTGITPPWGLMTGIRPVKKVTELMAQGLSHDEIKERLENRYELSPKNFVLHMLQR